MRRYGLTVYGNRSTSVELTFIILSDCSHMALAITTSTTVVAPPRRSTAQHGSSDHAHGSIWQRSLRRAVAVMSVVNGQHAVQHIPEGSDHGQSSGTGSVEGMVEPLQATITRLAVGRKPQETSSFICWDARLKCA